jgi:hypothetical protein
VGYPRDRLAPLRSVVAAPKRRRRGQLRVVQGGFKEGALSRKSGLEELPALLYGQRPTACLLPVPGRLWHDGQAQERTQSGRAPELLSGMPRPRTNEQPTLALLDSAECSRRTRTTVADKRYARSSGVTGQRHPAQFRRPARGRTSSTNGIDRVQLRGLFA